MKKWAVRFLAVALAAGLSVSAAAQDDMAGEAEYVNQGELAQRLVERLGLWRFLGPKPTNAECFGVLLAAGITPSEEGWVEDAPVGAGLLARVLVQALGGAALVPAERQNEPEAWMEALRSLLEDMGLIETVEGALSVLSPDEGIKTVIEWFNLSSDELRRRDVSISHITEIIRAIPPRRVSRPRDVTPDFPDADLFR